MADFLFYHTGSIIAAIVLIVLMAPVGGFVLRLCVSWIAGFRPAYPNAVLVALASYVTVMLVGALAYAGSMYIGYLLWEWLNVSRGAVMSGLNIVGLAIAAGLVMLSAWVVNRLMPTPTGQRMGMRNALMANCLHLLVTAVVMVAIALLVGLIVVGLNLDL